MADPLLHERIEREAWSSLFDACPKREKHELGLTARTIGDALVLSAPGLPHPLCNRAIGLGTAAPPTVSDVGAVVDAFERAGVERYFVHLWPGRGPAVAGGLAQRGLVRYPRGWVKLACEGEPRLDAGRCPLPARRARSTEAGSVGALIARAFDLPDRAAPLFGALITHPDWHVFVCTDADAPIGAGLLFAGHDGAYLAAAATDRAYRGRGVQHALLVARLRAALALGYRRFVSETGERVPGDPQHSQHNLERVGLRPVGVRDNYAPAGLRW